MTRKHSVTPEHAPKFCKWIAERGGVAIWPSVDLSDPEFSLSTPAMTPEGEPTPKPHWKVANVPSRVITDPEDIEVTVWQEVKRFHVGLRRGAQGLKIKLTDKSSARLRREVGKAGEDATYRFDYERQDAVIIRPAEAVTLAEWGAAHLLFTP